MAVIMMKSFLTLLQIILLGFGPIFLASDSFAQVDRAQLIQADIEKSIKLIIGSQLADSEYFVYAKVKLEEQPEGAAGTEDRFQNLPYSPIKVEKDYLEEMLRKGQGQYRQIAELTVTIVFDQRVPKEKVDLLTNVVRERFDFNDTTRKLDVKSLALVTEPVQQQEKLTFDRSKLDSERALLELQIQKEKFEMMKREEEVKKRLEEIEESKKGLEKLPGAEAEKSRPVEANANPTAPVTINNVEKPKGALDYLESFQLLIFAFIGALCLVGVTFLTGGVVKKGLQPVAEAIGRVGEGVGKISPSSGSGASESRRDTPKIPEKMQAPEPPAINPSFNGNSSQAEDKSLEEFLVSISEKLKILIEEKNFSFYRHFCDMIDSPTHRKLAASIMLTVDESSVASLLNGVSPEQIELLKDLLAKPGAVSEAQAIKKVALQEFFGRIAAEEFSGSPLFKLKNLTWLTSMNATQMANFALMLDQKLRTAFVACLTPSRLNAMISATDVPDDKKQILSVLKDLDTVSDKDIDSGLVQIEALFNKQKQNANDNKKRNVDTAKYMAQVAEYMDPEEQNLLMQEIKGDEELTKRMRDHIIPFDAVSLLPKELVSEIFATRTDLQIAQIIFSADEKVRASIMNVLPEIRKENVNSELSLFEANKVYMRRYQKTSLSLQSEICKYLLSLYREGILDFDGKKSESSPATQLGSVKNVA
jgi:hypothetical protein